MLHNTGLAALTPRTPSEVGKHGAFYIAAIISIPSENNPLFEWVAEAHPVSMSRCSGSAAVSQVPLALQQSTEPAN